MNNQNRRRQALAGRRLLCAMGGGFGLPCMHVVPADRIRVRRPAACMAASIGNAHLIQLKGILNS